MRLIRSSLETRGDDATATGVRQSFVMKCCDIRTGVWGNPAGWSTSAATACHLSSQTSVPLFAKHIYTIKLCKC